MQHGQIKKKKIIKVIIVNAGKPIGRFPWKGRGQGGLMVKHETEKIR